MITIKELLCWDFLSNFGLVVFKYIDDINSSKTTHLSQQSIHQPHLMIFAECLLLPMWKYITVIKISVVSIMCGWQLLHWPALDFQSHMHLLPQDFRPSLTALTDTPSHSRPLLWWFWSHNIKNVFYWKSVWTFPLGIKTHLALFLPTVSSEIHKRASKHGYGSCHSFSDN